MEEILRFQVNIFKWAIYSILASEAASLGYLMKTLRDYHAGLSIETVQTAILLAIEELIKQGFIQEVESNTGNFGKAYKRV